ncbi:MAG: hypothetical protein HY362_02870 [Candidatus Aenigmarchaeota archaeon]|nr:hypothetical protein [Candidatus Aenigmarchaeota archaeon]
MEKSFAFKITLSLALIFGIFGFLMLFSPEGIGGFSLFGKGTLSVGINEIGENGFLVTLSNIGRENIENITVLVSLPENSNIINPVDGYVEGKKISWFVNNIGGGEKRELNFTSDAVGVISVDAMGDGMLEKEDKFPVGKSFSEGDFIIDLEGIKNPVLLSFKISSLGKKIINIVETTTTLEQANQTTSTTSITIIPSLENTTSENTTTTLVLTNQTETTIQQENQTTTSTTSTTITSTTISTTTTVPTTTTEENTTLQGATGQVIVGSLGSIWVDFNGKEELVFEGTDGEGIYNIQNNTGKLRLIFRPSEGFQQVLEYYTITSLVQGKVKASVSLDVKQKQKKKTEKEILENEGWFARANADRIEESEDLNYTAITEGFVDSRGIILKTGNPLTMYRKVQAGGNKQVGLDFYFKTDYESQCQIGRAGIEVFYPNGESDTTYTAGINANTTLDLLPAGLPDFSGTIENTDFGWQHIQIKTRESIPDGRLYVPFISSNSQGCLSGFENFVVSGFITK